MKKVLSILLIASSILSAVSVMAQNKVVVIPLNSAKKLNNVVTVSAKGGDFSDPVAAVNSITDAAVDNPYLIVIGPGVYTLTGTLSMKSYVSIAGAGQEVTKLTGAISTLADDASSAIVSGSPNATLSDLSIENIGGSGYSTGIYNTYTYFDFFIRDVTVTASGGEAANTGIRNYSYAYPTMINVTASASGGVESRGMYIYYVSAPTVRYCTFKGDNNGIYTDCNSPAFTPFTSSSIIGGVNGTGTKICLNSNNGVDKELNTSCAEIP